MSAPMYRNRFTGQIGYRIQDDQGRDVISKEAEPGSKDTTGFSYNLGDWVEDKRFSVYQRSQLAIAAFAADAALVALVTHTRPKTWVELTEEKRVRFIEEGPESGVNGNRALDVRKKVFDLIVSIPEGGEKWDS